MPFVYLFVEGVVKLQVEGVNVFYHHLNFALEADLQPAGCIFEILRIYPQIGGISELSLDINKLSTMRPNKR